MKLMPTIGVEKQVDDSDVNILAINSVIQMGFPNELQTNKTWHIDKQGNKQFPKKLCLEMKNVFPDGSCR